MCGRKYEVLVDIFLAVLMETVVRIAAAPPHHVLDRARRHKLRGVGQDRAYRHLTMIRGDVSTAKSSRYEPFPSKHGPSACGFLFLLLYMASRFPSPEGAGA